MQRVPFEEWGLKSVPPLSRKRRAEMLRSLKGDGHEGECGGMEKGMGSTTRTSLLVDLLYPKNVIPSTRVLPELSRLATERQQLHRSRMWWSIAMTPLTIPIAIIPLIPNIPFFYLAYRAWSHWRALEGSKHLAFLLDNKLVAPNSHAALERLYHDNHTVVTGREKEKGMPFGDEDEEEAVTTTKIRTPAEEEHEPGLSKEERAAGAAAAARASAGGKEAYLQDRAILLRSSDGRKIADVLDAPELTGEIERAVYQVRHLKLSAQGTRERR
ncbi:hypothetical protein KEM55_002492 [Ascosphaera atra]|nr:hypothetical protein KEM55_002492 [Ascosphaera atra]